MSYVRVLKLGLAAALGVSIAIGCATVETKSRSPGTPIAEGINYFLPKKRVKFIATRTVLDPKDLRAQLAKAEETSKTAKALAESTAAQAAAEKAIHDRLEVGSPAQLEAEKRLKRAVVEAALAAENLGKFKVALDDVKARLWDVQFGYEDCAYSFAAKFEILAAEPDAEMAFTLLPKHNALRDDDVKLGVQPNGLLTSTNVIATDRTGDILVDLAGGIAGLQARTYGINVAEGKSEAPKKCEKEPKSFQYVFDPTRYVDTILDKEKKPINCNAYDNSHTIATLNERLKTAGFPYRLTSTGPEVCKLPIPEPSREQAAAIYYRTAAPYVLTVYQCLDGVGCDANSAEFDKVRPTDAILVQLPQAGPVAYVPMNSSAFVKTTNDVTFQDGVVTAWNTNRPSGALEFVRLPVKILKSILEVPASIFSIRIDHRTKEASLAAARESQVESDLKWKAVKDCLNAKSESPTEEQLACFPE